jgi:hypothetical protein
MWGQGCKKSQSSVRILFLQIRILYQIPDHLLAQQKELHEHLAKHGEHYGLSEYAEETQSKLKTPF